MTKQDKYDDNSWYEMDDLDNVWYDDDDDDDWWDYREEREEDEEN